MKIEQGSFVSLAFFLPLRALYFTIPSQSLNLQGGIVNVKSKKDYGNGDT